MYNKLRERQNDIHRFDRIKTPKSVAWDTFKFHITSKKKFNFTKFTVGFDLQSKTLAVCIQFIRKMIDILAHYMDWLSRYLFFFFRLLLTFKHAGTNHKENPLPWTQSFWLRCHLIKFREPNRRTTLVCTTLNENCL